MNLYLKNIQFKNAKIRKIAKMTKKIFDNACTSLLKKVLKRHLFNNFYYADFQCFLWLFFDCSLIIVKEQSKNNL